MHDKNFLKRVERITFDQFKEMAKDKTLSSHEKIGFPDSYRESYAEAIFDDIISKLPDIDKSQKKIADIGCGCDTLAHLMINRCEKNGNALYMLDSAEMLNLLSDDKGINKVAGKFPNESAEFIDAERNSFNAILVYSVMHHVCLEDNLFTFIDRAVELLAPGGRLLLGDLPNRTKRKRFFLSPQGIKTHREYTGDPNAQPPVNLFEIESEKLDDAIIFAILQRYRGGGTKLILCRSQKLCQCPTDAKIC